MFLIVKAFATAYHSLILQYSSSRKFQFLTGTYLAKRLRELSSIKTGSYSHEFLCRTDCSACADYQPCSTLIANAMCRFISVVNIADKCDVSIYFCC
jgi:hypothetical protein